MRNIYLAVVAVLLLIPILSHAQSTTTMQSLAVSQMFLYGEAAYNRGDYPEASKVFSKILMMEPGNSEALGYANHLREKGQDVFIPVKPVPVPEAVTPKAVVVPEVPKAIDPNQDLKDALIETDKSIEKVRTEIADLRTQMIKE